MLKWWILAISQGGSCSLTAGNAIEFDRKGAQVFVEPVNVGAAEPRHGFAGSSMRVDALVLSPIPTRPIVCP